MSAATEGATRIPDRVIAAVERAADFMLIEATVEGRPAVAANAARLAAHGYDAVRRHRRGGRR